MFSVSFSVSFLIVANILSYFFLLSIEKCTKTIYKNVKISFWSSNSQLAHVGFGFFPLFMLHCISLHLVGYATLLFQLLGVVRLLTDGTCPYYPV